jgi:uncharacterized protein Usg
MARTGDLAFARQLEGYGLSTVQIHYYLPDHPRLLQAFVMQQYDLARRSPSSTASSPTGGARSRRCCTRSRSPHNRLIGPAEWRAVDGVITITEPSSRLRGVSANDGGDRAPRSALSIRQHGLSHPRRTQ